MGGGVHDERCPECGANEIGRGENGIIYECFSGQLDGERVDGIPCLRNQLAQATGTDRRRTQAKPVTLDVRPEVSWFAHEMERKLQANDHKSHWIGESTNRLLKRLFDEFLELQLALALGSAKQVRDEAVDVANFAMMIADVVRSERGE